MTLPPKQKKCISQSGCLKDRCFSRFYESKKKEHYCVAIIEITYFILVSSTYYCSKKNSNDNFLSSKKATV